MSSHEIRSTADEKQGGSKKKWVAFLLLLLTIIGGTIFYAINKGTDTEPTPAPSPTVTETATVTPTPTPTPTPVVEDFNISVDGVAYKSKAELEKAVKSPAWVEPKVICDTYGQGVDGEYSVDYTVDYFTTQAKADAKYAGVTIGPAEYAQPVCMGYITDTKEIHDAMRETGTGTAGGTTSLYPFHEWVAYQDKVHSTIDTDKWFYYAAMTDYNSHFFFNLGLPEDSEEVKVSKMCFTVEGSMNFRKPAAEQTPVPGGCTISHSSEPQAYEILDTPAEEAEYRKGWAYAEKVARKK